MKMTELSAEAFGYPIFAYITELDEGLNILITGGIKTHVGAVSYAFPDIEPITMQLPEHKESVVSEKWARQLADTINAPVCVECGIHYDILTKEQIEIILSVSDMLLQKVNEKFKKNYPVG